MKSSSWFRRPTPLPLRKLLLRTIWGVTLSSFISGLLVMAEFFKSLGYITLIFPLPPLLLFFHYILRCWTWRYWLTICELILSSFEVAAFAFLSWAIFMTEGGNVKKILLDSAENQSPFTLFVFISFTALAPLCFLSFLCVTWDTLIDRGRDLFKPYRCLGGLPETEGWNAIFSSSAMKKRFTSDTPWLIRLRGALATLLLLLVAAAAIWTTVGQPLRLATTSIEIRTFYAPVIKEKGNLFYIADTTSVPHIQPQVVFNSGQFDLGSEVTFYRIGQDVNGTATVEDICTTRGDPDNNGFTHLICPEITVDQLPCTYYMSFDFSKVSNKLTSNTNISMAYLPVYLGFTNSTTAVVQNTSPIFLFPGMRLFSSAEAFYREEYKNVWFAALGAPQYRRYLAADVNSWPVEDDELVPLPNNSSVAMHIFFDFPPKIRHEQDYIDGSAIGSFALLGGIWTFLNGVFAAVFGSSLLLIVCDRKPLSVYGLVHSLRNKVELHREEGEISLEEQRRILTILRDHLLSEGEGGDPKARSPSMSYDDRLPPVHRQRYDRVNTTDAT